MKKKDLFTFVGIGLIAAIFSYIVAGKFFSPSPERREKAPVVEPISSELPSVKSDQSYQVIFNKNALDPTQLIKIGNSQNKAPFDNP